MSVLLQGLSIPDWNPRTINIYRDGAWCDAYTTENGKAIEVPPHGRLIDADAFKKDECNRCDGACESLPCDCLNCEADCRCDFIKDIADAPTIILAEDGENGT